MRLPADFVLMPITSSSLDVEEGEAQHQEGDDTAVAAVSDSAVTTIRSRENVVPVVDKEVNLLLATPPGTITGQERGQEERIVKKRVPSSLGTNNTNLPQESSLIGGLMQVHRGGGGRLSVAGPQTEQLNVVPTSFDFMENRRRVRAYEEALTSAGAMIAAAAEADAVPIKCYDVVLEFSKQKLILTRKTMLLNTQFGRQLAMNKLFIPTLAFMGVFFQLVFALSVGVAQPPSHLANTRCHKVNHTHPIGIIFISLNLIYFLAFFVMAHRTHRGLAYQVVTRGGLGPYMIFINLLRANTIQLYVVLSCFGTQDSEVMVVSVLSFANGALLGLVLGWLDAIYVSMRVKRFFITLLVVTFCFLYYKVQMTSEALAAESHWNDELSIWVMKATAIQQRAGAFGLIAIYLGQIWYCYCWKRWQFAVLKLPADFVLIPLTNE